MSAVERPPRVKYETAGRATRAAMLRLAAATRRNTGPSQYREIVGFVITQVGTYSRTSDGVKRKAVAEIFGVDARTVSRALKWAADEGVVGWSPGLPGREWLVDLQPECVDAPLDTSRDDLSTPPAQFAREPVHTTEETDEKTYEKTLAPTGEGPRGEIPRSKRGPKRLDGLEIPIEELLLSEGEPDDDARDLAAVLLALPSLSRAEEDRIEDVERLVHRSDPHAVLDAAQDAAQGADAGETVTAAQVMAYVVKILDGLNTRSTLEPSEVVSIADLAFELWPDPDSRRTGLYRSSAWTDKRFVVSAPRALPERLRKIAGDMHMEVAQCG